MNPDLKKSFWPMLLAVALTAAGTALIRANRVETTSVERTPMPVAATVYREQSTYTRQASYLGMVRAGSDSVVGFEVAGVLTAMQAAEGEGGTRRHTGATGHRPTAVPPGCRERNLQSRGRRARSGRSPGRAYRPAGSRWLCLGARLRRCTLRGTSTVGRRAHSPPRNGSLHSWSLTRARFVHPMRQS